MTVRVALVEDESDLREVIRLALERDGRFSVVGEAGDGATAISMTAETRPDVIVVDLGLPDAVGLDLIPTLLDVAPQARVVVFSGSPAESTAADAIERGASRYVVKGSVGSLVAALSAVAGSSNQLERRFPCDVGSIRGARRAASEGLSAWGRDDLVEVVSLIVSELATNAVVHAESAFTLSMALSQSALRIEVADCGAGAPNPRTPNQRTPGGRGLHIITALSIAWGLESTSPDCKTVWCEVALTG